MLDYLIRKEKVLHSLIEGLVNKGYSYKIWNGINNRLDLIRDLKNKCQIDLLINLIESTNYPVLVDVIKGLDNISLINKNKSDWYLISIDKDNLKREDANILQECMLNDNALIYLSEKNISAEIKHYYIIFSQKKYVGANEYINHRWQGR